MYPELRRYRQAGARRRPFRFPGDGSGHDAFFMTELMTDYSKESSSKEIARSSSSTSGSSSHRHQPTANEFFVRCRRRQ